MHYFIEYELCALFFLMIITVQFYKMRRFPNRQNQLFGAMLICAIADLTLNITGALSIEHASFIPIWLGYLANTLYLVAQATFPVLMMAYVMVLTGLSLKLDRRLRFLLTPAVLSLIMLAVNLFTGVVFSISAVNGVYLYIRGPWFYYFYALTVFYLITSITFSYKYKQRLLKKQFSTIMCFAIVVLTAMIFQLIYSRLLLTGVALAAAILMMFFTLQNPEDMLDLISGVFNYSAMMNFLADRLRYHQRLWLVAVDINDMRRINSTMGIGSGNAVLQNVGEFLNSMRGTWSFRMIGTRFLIVAQDENTYKNVIAALRERFEKPWKANGWEIILSAIIRHFCEPDFFNAPEDVVDLIELSFEEHNLDPDSNEDIAGELLAQAKHRSEVENALRMALATGHGLELYYQPIYKPSTGSFCGAEAFLRLNDPHLGSIPPCDFIPVAEKTGLIIPLDKLVLQKACEFIKRRNIRNSLGMKFLNINLSAAEFFRNCSNDFLRVIRSYGTDPSLLCLEVTETAATVHRDMLITFMRDLSEAGCRFALDDFGTGYANLTQAMALPFDVVKLDRSLLLIDDGRSCRVFDDLVVMFSRLGIHTVVEGVETLEQDERVRRIGADGIQGFFYSHPMPENEFCEFMEFVNKNHA